MRAAGLSLTRIARPVLILGALGAALALYVNFESMPVARVKYHKDLDAAIAANPLSLIVPRTFVRNFKGYVVYVGDRTGRRPPRFLALATRPRGAARSPASGAPRLAALRLRRRDQRPHPRPSPRAQVEERNPKQPENFTEIAPRRFLREISRVRNASPSRASSKPAPSARNFQWMTYAELRARGSPRRRPRPSSPRPRKTTPAPS